MIEWITNNIEFLTRLVLIPVVLVVGVWMKINEVRSYEEIRFGNVKGVNVMRDFSILKSKGYDVRIKTGMGSPRGQLASVGTYQNTQTLLIKKVQKGKALNELARNES